MAEKTNVCIVGSGNWGSAIAKIVGVNAATLPEFEDRVTMYVYEEVINGKKLTEIINTTHENVKYLPGHKLPENVVAVPDLVEAAKNADILIFVVPHQFIPNFCKTLLGKIKTSAIAISLIKGFDKAEGGGIDLISHIITRHLKIPCSVLMGANLANEVAEEQFCETTIGCRDAKFSKVLRDLFQSRNFRVVVVDDADAVEVCGALKNIVACGAGFVDGLALGDNTKAAVIRLGLMEMIRFVDVFYPGCKLSTFFESCGVADLITTCYGGRNRKVSEAFVKTGKSFEKLEAEMLNGQKLQGPPTAEEVNYMLKTKGLEEKFPLFTAIHKISTGVLKPLDLIDCIRHHPEHIQDFSKTEGKKPNQNNQNPKKQVCGPKVEPPNREYHQQATNKTIEMRQTYLNAIQHRRLLHQVSSNNNNHQSTIPVSNGLSASLRLNLNRFGSGYKPFSSLKLSLLLAACAFKLTN